jgi:lysozyme family protein
MVWLMGEWVMSVMMVGLEAYDYYSYHKKWRQNATFLFSFSSS